jgi:mevalonate kinase
MSAKRGRGHGLGKLILCGEHAVVFGHPALAFAVDRGTTVELVQTEGPLLLTSEFSDDPRLMRAFRSILPDEGWRIRVHSDLPIGRGMGSSAALAVATARAAAAAAGHALNDRALFERAMPMERIFHGNPSGLDVAAAIHGGLLRYRRGPPIELQHLTTPSGWQVVVLDSGEPGDTAALVAMVASQRPGIDPLLQRVGDLVEQAGTLLDQPEALGPLLTENHQLLREAGVSTPKLDALVSLALDCGAFGAKLAGAGGGGVVLALVHDPADLCQAAAARGIPHFSCAIGHPQ